ncbi:uncharacterized protein LOC101846486 [Aplysia californica]|uniref:Uncharacterized protein LOC101846486 n=1 Tax=Aplysia californica TaxID=6500 RepID=A0ABM0JFH2_APLCA|nr:uncharacterized protein LOC101846486 [Aplysia californica]XP_005092489.1 uncharacterized protein LOC101846486 [Aplysia californica]XP_005092490.1 uncharacterized protein LOC101846486 [Aplysia californica]XP_035824107.1 uncharacterized protein LOC101846486 [Aplysia californica]XP_035824108.1 uncharacterized protein LOC101846486 [Aplysia californica]XP_035824109.1 uncharacterized protein LOC101846486 [Aplysia californica]XP_035824110.1 uncharacterized protein LOC101846486 [Aplysia californic
MSDSNTMSTLQKAGNLLISLIFRMTVKLTVELLKIGLILVILVGFFAAVISFVAATVWWVYTRSDGSLSAAILALCLSVFAVYALAYLTQFVTRDVLHLTNMSLPGLIVFLFRLIWHKRGSAEQKQEDSGIGLCNALFDDNENQEKKRR